MQPDFRRFGILETGQHLPDHLVHRKGIRVDGVVNQPGGDRNGKFDGQLLQFAQRLATTTFRLLQLFFDRFKKRLDCRPLLTQLVL